MLDSAVGGTILRWVITLKNGIICELWVSRSILAVVISVSVVTRDDVTIPYCS